MIKKKFHIPMFFQHGIDVLFAYATEKQYNSYCKKHFKGHDVLVNDCAGNWAYIFFDKVPLYIIRIEPTDYINYRTCVHEIIHMVDHLKEYEHIKCEETPALIGGWLAEELINWIIKVK